MTSHLRIRIKRQLQESCTHLVKNNTTQPITVHDDDDDTEQNKTRRILRTKTKALNWERNYGLTAHARTHTTHTLSSVRKYYSTLNYWRMKCIWFRLGVYCFIGCTHTTSSRAMWPESWWLDCLASMGTVDVRSLCVYVCCARWPWERENTIAVTDRAQLIVQGCTKGLSQGDRWPQIIYHNDTSNEMCKQWWIACRYLRHKILKKLLIFERKFLC